jgi:hypothetical protein
VLALALLVLLVSTALAAETAYDRRTRRIERERHARDVKALERELQIGLPLDVRLGADPIQSYIAALPEPTPLGLHIDCLLRMGVITFALSEREPQPLSVTPHAGGARPPLGSGGPSRSESAGARTDWRIRLTPLDEQAARELAFNGGRYPQGESYRLLRLALHELDYLRSR